MENQSYGDASNSPEKKGKGWLAGSIICLILTVADIALLIYCACAEVPFAGTSLENNMLMSGVGVFVSFGVEIVIFMAVAHFCLKRYEKANTELRNVLKIYYYISLPFYYVIFGIVMAVIGIGLLIRKWINSPSTSPSSSSNKVVIEDEKGYKHELTYQSSSNWQGIKYYKDEKGNEWQTYDGKEFKQSK